MNNNLPTHKSRLIQLTQQLITEMQVLPGQRQVSLNDSLQSQLGIDSISRGELANRIEKEFNVELPLQKVLEAETLADLLAAIAVALPTSNIESPTVELSPLEELTIDPSN